MEAISLVFADRVTVPGFLGMHVQAEVISSILELKADKILLVIDTVVDELHGHYMAPLQGVAVPGETGERPPHVDKYVLPQGDACKSWEHLSGLVEWAFKVEATKRTVIVAFGGGALIGEREYGRSVAGVLADSVHQIAVGRVIHPQE